DSWQQHAADTIKESYHLADPQTVEIVAQGAQQGIADLERYGMGFAREEDGRISQRFFGAHTFRRTAFAGDYTGLEIQRSLVKRSEQLDIAILDTVYITDILTEGNTVFGAYGFDVNDGRRYLIHADAVILAAGGHNRIWRRTSSRRDENTGDSFRLAVEAGARLRDPELVQFHPSGIIEPENAAGTLISEAARGEGGILRNALGERFMERYDPERMELSTRDRVALAAYTEIQEGRGTAHYSMGGVWVRPEDHSTDVAGLYVIGEASSGLHGANRLGGNSLIELLVFGRIVGQAAAHYSVNLPAQTRSAIAIARARGEVDRLLAADGTENVRALQRAIRDMMTEYAGVVRTEAGLTAGLAQLDEIEARMANIGIHPDIAGFQDLAHAYDLKSSALSARATLEAALERRETRGCHNRSDYPDMDPAMQVNLVWSPTEGVTREEIAPVPEDISALIRVCWPAAKRVQKTPPPGLGSVPNTGHRPGAILLSISKTGTREHETFSTR
ncbi:MAG: FAD-binding protein, partial [Yaniella sp.]|nr:FAD-binding protein [Yaniella sp.]